MLAANAGSAPPTVMIAPPISLAMFAIASLRSDVAATEVETRPTWEGANAALGLIAAAVRAIVAATFMVSIYYLLFADT